MEQLRIDNIVIETTRRCNMVCDHCLRGKAENINMRKSIQEKFLSHVCEINSATFTGGEPSLYPQAINDFIDICIEKNIYVGNFYIATNAKQASDEFILALVRLYLFCKDNEMSQVQISNDEFHQNDKEAIKRLQALKFVDFKYQTTSKYPPNYINEGLYKENYNRGRDIGFENFSIDEDNIMDGTIMLNCKGLLIAGCDWSYESQRDRKTQICHVNNKSYLNAINKYNKLNQKED